MPSPVTFTTHTCAGVVLNNVVSVVSSVVSVPTVVSAVLAPVVSGVLMPVTVEMTVLTLLGVEVAKLVPAKHICYDKTYHIFSLTIF